VPPDEYRNRLILDHRYLVRAIAGDYRQFIRQRADWDDLLAEGTLGLVEAAAEFDPAVAPSAPLALFKHYARRNITWKVYSFISNLTGSQEIPTDFQQHPPPAKPQRIPSLEPLFGCGQFTPKSACPDHRPIHHRSRLFCARCHYTGWDDHPLMQLSARDPRPQKKRTVAHPPQTAGQKLRRKQFQRASSA
jgi:hypothetical protein